MQGRAHNKGIRCAEGDVGVKGGRPGPAAVMGSQRKP